MSQQSFAYIEKQQRAKDQSDSRNPRESLLVKELAARTGDLVGREKDSLSNAEAVEFVNDDLNLADGIQDKEYRLWAAAMMGYAGEAQAAYKTELEQKSPEMANEASQAMEQIEAGLVIENEESLLKALNSRTQELAAMDKDTLSHSDASERAQYDAALMAGITAEGDRLFAAVGIGDAAKQQAEYMKALREQAPELAEEVQRALQEDEQRSSAKEDRKSDEMAATGFDMGIEAARDTGEPLFDLEDEQGSIEPTMGDVHVSVDTLNSIEPVLTISGNGKAAPAVVDIDAESPEAVKAQVQAAAPGAAEVPGLAKRAEKAAEETAEFLKRAFTVAGKEYHFKDKTDPKQSLAFVDKESQIATPHDDPEVIDSMLKLADSKGWNKLNVKGSEDFRREAWIKASAQGFEVTGYKPSEIDIARMQAARDKLNTNQLTGKAIQGGSIENSATKASGGRSDAEVKAYTSSKEYAETVASIAANLKGSGYPVDDKFKDAIGKHLAAEFQQGRKLEKAPEVERATPALRLVEPSRNTGRDHAPEHAGREMGGHSR